MPRTTIPASTFANGAASGMSKLAMALGGAGAAGGPFEAAKNNELKLQTQIALALSTMGAHDATTALNNVKAEGERADIAARQPEAIQRTAMLANGIPLDETPTVSNWLNTGKLGGAYTPDAAGVGPTIPAPDWAANLGPVARSIAGTQRALTIGDKNSVNIAKAASIERGDRLSDSVITGALPRNVVAGAQAASGGKPLFHTDATGSVLDQYTGALDASNPLAQSTIGLRTQQANQAKAGAAENYAQGRAADALAKQRNQVTANGPGPGKVPVGYRYTAGTDGEVRLEPIPGGPKDPHAQTGKPLPAAAAKGVLENQTALRQVEKALALMDGQTVGSAQGDPSATGWKGYTPDFILNRMDPAGTATRALIADIGSLKIHDRSGAAVTVFETPRLKPFIPSVTDSPATVKEKLQLFRDNYQAIMDDAAGFYRASGFNVPALPMEGQPAQSGAPAAASGWSITPIPGN